MIFRLLARVCRDRSWSWFLQKRGGQKHNYLILGGSRVTSRHLQIDGPVDGDRLILYNLPLERTVARSPWPAAALDLARRHRHFRPFGYTVTLKLRIESLRTIAGNGVFDADSARPGHPPWRDGRSTHGRFSCISDCH